MNNNNKMDGSAKKQLPKCIYDPEATHAGEKLAIIIHARDLNWNPDEASIGVENSVNDKAAHALANGVMSLCMYVKTKDARFLDSADKFAAEAHAIYG
tara:strand:- start:828 stop:1121 length:294 start_codon:yes stop_codon:yes gene_type:complete